MAAKRGCIRMSPGCSSTSWSLFPSNLSVSEGWRQEKDKDSWEIWDGDPHHLVHVCSA